MRVLAAAAVVLVVVLRGTTAFAGANGSIDLFPYGVDPRTGGATTVDFGQCQGTPTTIWDGQAQMLILGVFARLNGASLAGIAAAQLFIEGIETLPGYGTQWTVSRVEYPVNTIYTGNNSALYQARDAGGVLERVQGVLWTEVTGPGSPNCQKAVLTEIARIYLINIGSPLATIPDDWRIKVIAGDPTYRPPLNCPLLVLCDYPDFTAYCVTGGQFIVNPVQLSCSVDVQATTWGTLKAMYR